MADFYKKHQPPSFPVVVHGLGSSYGFIVLGCVRAPLSFRVEVLVCSEREELASVALEDRQPPVSAPPSFSSACSLDMSTAGTIASTAHHANATAAPAHQAVVHEATEPLSSPPEAGEDGHQRAVAASTTSAMSVDSAGAAPASTPTSSTSWGRATRTGAKNLASNPRSAAATCVPTRCTTSASRWCSCGG